VVDEKIILDDVRRPIAFQMISRIVADDELMYIDPQAVSGSAFVSASETCGMCRLRSCHPYPYCHPTGHL
jgi:hypothetical protein